MPLDTNMLKLLAAELKLDSTIVDEVSGKLIEAADEIDSLRSSIASTDKDISLLVSRMDGVLDQMKVNDRIVESAISIVSEQLGKVAVSTTDTTDKE